MKPDYDCDEPTPVLQFSALRREIRDHIETENARYDALSERIDALVMMHQAHTDSVKELVDFATSFRVVARISGALGKVILFFCTLCGAVYGAARVLTSR